MNQTAKIALVLFAPLAALVVLKISTTPVLALEVLASAPFARIINGTTGNDNLVGTELRDRLGGRAGNDVLNGLGGDDRLVGGSDNDTLIGGNGADRFICGGGDDTVKDFNASEGDTIKLNQTENNRCEHVLPTTTVQEDNSITVGPQ
jgi:hypothetical protein